MTWHRSDDGFPEHPKCDALADHFGDDWAACAVAFMTWHHMGCDCAARRTDGAFNAARAHRVVRAPREVIDRALTALVKVALLDKRRDGFVFHDWAEYQPTRAELDAERASKTDRQRRWRENRSKNSHGVDGAVDASTSRLVDGAVDASVDPPVDGAPSRPVPSRPDPSPSGSAEGASAPSAPVVPTIAAHTPKAKRPKVAPKPDPVPAPGTLARRLYDAIVNDRDLGAITAGPGDASERWADPATFPGVDVLAEVRRAGEYVATKPGRYRDGRAFLRGWLQRKADEVARAPKPVPPPSRPTAPAVRTRPVEPQMSDEQRAETRARLADAVKKAITP